MREERREGERRGGFLLSNIFNLTQQIPHSLWANTVVFCISFSFVEVPTV